VVIFVFKQAVVVTDPLSRLTFKVTPLKARLLTFAKFAISLMPMTKSSDASVFYRDAGSDIKDREFESVHIRRIAL